MVHGLRYIYLNHAGAGRISASKALKSAVGNISNGVGNGNLFYIPNIAFIHAVDIRNGYAGEYIGRYLYLYICASRGNTYSQNGASVVAVHQNGRIPA